MIFKGAKYRNSEKSNRMGEFYDTVILASCAVITEAVFFKRW